MSRFFCIICFIVFGALSAQSISAEDYPIGAGDALDISVFARPDLSRMYRVRLDGTISMHIVGSIEAAGRFPGELESEIEARLTDAFSGAESATLEVAAYRGVVVSGDVMAPGLVAFHPNIDVRSAVALAQGAAGGQPLESVGDQMRAEAEATQAAVYAVRLASLKVTRARLIATRDGSPTLDLTETLPAEVGSLTEVTTTMLESQKVQRAFQEHSLADQVRLARDEVTAFADRRQLLLGQLDSLNEVIEERRLNLQRGLTTSDRLLDLTRDRDRLNADILEAIGLEAAALSRLNSVSATKDVEQMNLDVRVSEALIDTETLIRENTVLLERSRAFVQEFGSIIPTTEGEMAHLSYLIHRRTAGAMEVIPASLDTYLQPGDGLVVSRVFDAAEVSY